MAVSMLISKDKTGSKLLGTSLDPEASRDKLVLAELLALLAILETEIPSSPVQMEQK
jgi:hypothetical protein